MFKELCCQIVITPYLTSRVDKTNHGLVTAPFFVQILKCLLQFLELSRGCLCNQPLLLLLRYAGAIQQTITHKEHLRQSFSSVAIFSIASEAFAP